MSNRLVKKKLARLHKTIDNNRNSRYNKSTDRSYSICTINVIAYREVIEKIKGKNLSSHFFV